MTIEKCPADRPGIFPCVDTVTGSASTQVLSAAQSLSGDSSRLKLEVGKFLNAVRAA